MGSDMFGRKEQNNQHRAYWNKDWVTLAASKLVFGFCQGPFC